MSGFKKKDSVTNEVAQQNASSKMLLKGLEKGLNLVGKYFDITLGS